MKKDWNQHLVYCKNDSCPGKQGSAPQQLNFTTSVINDAVFTCPHCDSRVTLEENAFTGAIKVSSTQWSENGIRGIRSFQGIIVSLLALVLCFGISQIFAKDIPSPIPPIIHDLRTWFGPDMCARFFQAMQYLMGALMVISLIASFMLMDVIWKDLATAFKKGQEEARKKSRPPS